MTVSRSRTALLHHPSLLIGGSSVSISKSIRLLGVTLDNKLTFEEQLQSMTAAISQKAGLLRKCHSAFGNDDAVKQTFFVFILPSFEYCMPVWLSAASSHLELLDRVLSNLEFILPDFNFSLVKRRKVGCLTLLFRILNNPDHPLYNKPFFSKLKQLIIFILFTQ